MMMCYFQKAFMLFFYCLNCSKNTLVDIRLETQDLVVILFSVHNEMQNSRNK